MPRFFLQIHAAEEAMSLWADRCSPPRLNSMGIFAQCLRYWIQPEHRASFIEQELARFSNDQRFVYYEHVVAGVMQFDDSRVLNARAKALDCAFYPLRERLDVAIEFLLRGRVQIPVVGQTVLRCDFIEN